MMKLRRTVGMRKMMMMMMILRRNCCMKTVMPSRVIVTVC